MPRSETCEVEGCNNPAAFIEKWTYLIKEDGGYGGPDLFYAIGSKNPVLHSSLCPIHAFISRTYGADVQQIPLAEAKAKVKARGR